MRLFAFSKKRDESSYSTSSYGLINEQTGKFNFRVANGVGEGKL